MAVSADAVIRWVGRSVPRVEDPPLLRGEGRFVADLAADGALHLAVVRSPHASARILGIDGCAALRMPGVHSVLTAADLPHLGVLRPVLDRPEFAATSMPVLSSDVVRHVGEPVAAVLASDPYIAEDAAEAVAVTYEVLPVVASTGAARAAGAPLVHADVPGNLLLDVAFRDEPDLDAALATAHVVVEATIDTARVTAAPMEGRACLAEVDAGTGRLTLWTSTQMPHLVRSVVASLVGIPESAVRVVAPDVGGGFGQKVCIAREEVLVAALSHHLGRAVRWIADRQENLTADYSGHEQQLVVRAGFDGEGRFVGLDADITTDVGAYHCYPMTAGVEVLMAAGELPGPYHLPLLRVHTRGVATHKPPMAPYRGVARPQAIMVTERLLDKAARTLGLDPVTIRHRNLIPRAELPRPTITGIVLDDGTYGEALDRCAALLDVAGWPRRQTAARAQGRLLGLGLSCFAERTGFGTPVFAARGMTVTPGYETAEVRMDAGGGVTVSVGTHGHGQGHRTTLAQVVADQLGVHVDTIRVVEGDTDDTPHGWGTFASRTAVIGGGACHRASGRLADTLRGIAAHRLEASEADIELRDGNALVRGSPSSAIPVTELARIAHHAAHLLPQGDVGGLFATAGFDPPGTYSNATHGAVVEVDVRTGAVTVLRFVVVEDCGVVIHPTIVDGQVRGGVTQGIAKALWERLDHDEDGQCRTASFMDYLLPTAAEIPVIEIEHLATPSAHSLTGAKGVGEGGTIGAPAAIANAVSDALAHLGVECDRLPIDSGELLAAIRPHTAGSTS